MEEGAPALELLQRLGVGRPSQRTVAGPLPVVHRDERLSPLLEVLRQQLGLMLLDLAEALLERAGNAQVQPLTPRPWHRVVRGIADQRVLEDVALAASAAPGEEQPRIH